MAKQCELTGHTARIVQMVMSPDGNSVMTGSSDETLRIWNYGFTKDMRQAIKKKSTAKLQATSLLRPNIR